MRRLFLFTSILLTACALCALPANAATRNRYGYDEEQAAAVREIRDTVFELRHEVHNHEEELRILDDRLKNYEAIIDSVRDQVQDSTMASKEMVKGNSASLESKIGALEIANKSMINDLKQFKTYSNDSATALTQAKQKISDLERIIEVQNQNINHLEGAVQALLEAMQVNDPSKPAKQLSLSSSSAPSTATPHRYKVKSGDSLEKIARANHTTIKALREANPQLVGDKIIEGQTLKIPEK